MDLLVWYPKCSTCRKAYTWLQDKGIEVELRDIREEKPTLEELRQWIARSGLGSRKFFNTSGMLYRELGLKDKLDGMSEEERLELLATDGMLVKRPVLVTEGKVFAGFREKDWEEYYGKQR